MEFYELPEFEKDVKQLLKKYRTLNDDLEVVKSILIKKPDDRPPFSFLINNLGIKTCVIKVKKIACKALKGSGVNSGLRLIYAYLKEENAIVLIEVYHKNDKKMEDRQRIMDNFS
ncbi:MAG: hypothetical protein IPN33_03665 [Saprospiraceae bacterium]|nr:hypothetical protein [Saprospiraceae bacterium]